MNAITNIKPLLPIVVQNEEPRVLDTDLAKRLGMKTPRNIRKSLIVPNQHRSWRHMVFWGHLSQMPESGADRPRSSA